MTSDRAERAEYRVYHELIHKAAAYARQKQKAIKPGSPHSGGSFDIATSPFLAPLSPHDRPAA